MRARSKPGEPVRTPQSGRADAFSGCHPAVGALYFGLVLLFSMFLMHPLCLTVSLGGGLACDCCLHGTRTALRRLRWLLPVLLVTAAVNPLFNHEGATILGYLPGGNPLTAESLYYGAASAVLLISVLIWFACCTTVMTGDKLIWLFGRVIPVLSLVLSMTLRWVPRFRAQARVITEARRGLGRTDGRRFRRIREGVAVFSVLLTWSLENAVDTADSMRARGYGLPGRTSFSVYRMDGRDRGLIVWMLFCGGAVAAGWLAGALRWSYYPVLHGAPLHPLTAGVFLFELALCLTPVILNLTEERTWKRLRSEL